MKHLKNCNIRETPVATTKKCTVATFHIICCNIENESLQNNDEIWLVGTLVTTKLLDPKGEKEEKEEVQKEGADLDPVGERRRRETSDLDPSLPTSLEPRRRPRL
jgi:hypothetical protein